MPANSGWATRLAKSVICRMVSVSLKKATYCTAVPPSVDLLMTGSVTPAGNWY